MTLTNFLAALKTKDVLVTVTNKDDEEICKIYSSGYDALDSLLEVRTIYRWEIKGAAAITIVLNDSAISA